MPRQVSVRTDNKPLKAREMVAWIKANVPPESRPNQSPLEAACWFCAYQEATDVVEFSMRELAQLLQSGHPGYKRLCDIDNYIDAYDTRDDLIAAMYDFWKNGDHEE